MEGVKRKVLVLSGKGGVGKSTFTAGLSWALAADEDCQVSTSERSERGRGEATRTSTSEATSGGHSDRATRTRVAGESR